MSTSYWYDGSPLLFAYFFIHPGRLFVFSRVNAPAMYHIPGAGKGFSRLNLLKSIPLPCHARWSKVCRFSLLTLFNFSAIVLILIEEVSRPGSPCVLCERLRAVPSSIFCFYDISSGAFIGCLPGFKPNFAIFIKFNANVIIA